MNKKEKLYQYGDLAILKDINGRVLHTLILPFMSFWTTANAAEPKRSGRLVGEIGYGVNILYDDNLLESKPHQTSLLHPRRPRGKQRCLLPVRLRARLGMAVEKH